MPEGSLWWPSRGRQDAFNKDCEPRARWPPPAPHTEATLRRQPPVRGGPRHQCLSPGVVNPAMGLSKNPRRLGGGYRLKWREQREISDRFVRLPVRTSQAPDREALIFLPFEQKTLTGLLSLLSTFVSRKNPTISPRRRNSAPPPNFSPSSRMRPRGRPQGLPGAGP